MKLTIKVLDGVGVHAAVMGVRVAHNRPVRSQSDTHLILLEGIGARRRAKVEQNLARNRAIRIVVGAVDRHALALAERDVVAVGRIAHVDDERVGTRLRSNDAELAVLKLPLRKVHDVIAIVTRNSDHPIVLVDPLAVGLLNAHAGIGAGMLCRGIRRKASKRLIEVDLERGVGNVDGFVGGNATGTGGGAGAHEGRRIGGLLRKRNVGTEHQIGALNIGALILDIVQTLDVDKVVKRVLAAEPLHGVRRTDVTPIGNEQLSGDIGLHIRALRGVGSGEDTEVVETAQRRGIRSDKGAQINLRLSGSGLVGRCSRRSRRIIRCRRAISAWLNLRACRSSRFSCGRGVVRRGRRCVDGAVIVHGVVIS